MSSRAKARDLGVCLRRHRFALPAKTKVPRFARDESFGGGFGMREERRYFVYIIANASKVLYTGMTNSLRQRVREHKLKLTPGFAAQSTTSPGSSISRALKTCVMRSSARSKSRHGLAPSGLRRSSRRIRSGTICRESGISHRHFVLHPRSHSAWAKCIARIHRNQGPSLRSG